MSTRPAPSRPRADRPLVRRDPLDLEPERELPLAEADPDHAADLAEPADGPEGPEGELGGTKAPTAAAGAMPQVSQ